MGPTALFQQALSGAAIETDAALLPQARRVVLVPALHHLAASQAEDADSFYLYAVAGRGDAPEPASVGGAHGPADRHPIPFGEHVVDDVVGVGKGRKPFVDEPLEVFEARQLRV